MCGKYHCSANAHSARLASGPKTRKARTPSATPRGIQARVPCASRYHFHGANVFTDLSHRHAGQQELKLFRCIPGAESQQLQAVLIEHEMDRWRALAPVLVDLTGMGICPHDRLNLIGDCTELLGVGAHDAKVDQVARIGTKDQLRDTHAGLGCESFGGLAS